VNNIADQTVRAFYCLGSNIDAMLHIQNACNALSEQFEQVAFSRIYESKAVGFSGENFLNLVVQIRTQKSMKELLDIAEKLEQEAGREREYRGAFDSRTLDVDLLMYADRRGRFHGKRLPNSDILLHAHVLAPLRELAGDLIHPDKDKSFNQLWGDFDSADQSVWVCEQQLV